MIPQPTLDLNPATQRKRKDNSSDDSDNIVLEPGREMVSARLNAPNDTMAKKTSPMNNPFASMGMIQRMKARRAAKNTEYLSDTTAKNAGSMSDPYAGMSMVERMEAKLAAKKAEALSDSLAKSIRSTSNPYAGMSMVEPIEVKLAAKKAENLSDPMAKNIRSTGNPHAGMSMIEPIEAKLAAKKGENLSGPKAKNAEPANDPDTEMGIIERMETQLAEKKAEVERMEVKLAEKKAENLRAPMAGNAGPTIDPYAGMSMMERMEAMMEEKKAENLGRHMAADDKPVRDPFSDLKDVQHKRDIKDKKEADILARMHNDLARINARSQIPGIGPLLPHMPLGSHKITEDEREYVRRLREKNGLEPGYEERQSPEEKERRDRAVARQELIYAEHARLLEARNRRNREIDEREEKERQERDAAQQELINEENARNIADLNRRNREIDELRANERRAVRQVVSYPDLPRSSSLANVSIVEGGSSTNYRDGNRGRIGRNVVSTEGHASTVATAGPSRHRLEEYLPELDDGQIQEGLPTRTQHRGDSQEGAKKGFVSPLRSLKNGAHASKQWLKKTFRSQKKNADRSESRSPTHDDNSSPTMPRFPEISNTGTGTGIFRRMSLQEHRPVYTPGPITHRGLMEDYSP